MELGEIIEGGKGPKNFSYIGVNRQLMVVVIPYCNVTAPKAPFLEKLKKNGIFSTILGNGRRKLRKI